MKPGVDFPGVGCGLVIQRGDGRVLLCKRLKAPEAGFWNIVGGKVDLAIMRVLDARKRALQQLRQRREFRLGQRLEVGGMASGIDPAYKGMTPIARMTLSEPGRVDI